MALPYVLWATMIVTAIAMTLLPQSVTSAKIERNAWDRFERDMAMDAALNDAVFDLVAAQTVAEARLGAPRAVRIGRYVVDIVVEDELGKVDLNMADEDLIRRALRAAGAGSSEADAIARNILDWRGDRAGRDAAARNVHGGAVRNGPFQSVGEVRLVEGVTDDLYARLAPMVTIHAQARFIDPATAPPALLRALPGYTAGRIDDIIARRAAAAAGTLDPGEANRTPLAGRALTVRMRMEDGRSAARETVVRMTESGKGFWIVNRR